MQVNFTVSYFWPTHPTQLTYSDSRVNRSFRFLNHPSDDPCFSPCQGSAVQLWGPVGPNDSPFSVSIDGRIARPLSPNSHVQAHNSSSANTAHLLFAHYNLTEGTHLFEIRNNPLWTNSSEASTTLSIDHLMAFTLPNPTKSTSNAITSIIVGTSIAGFCLLVFTLWSIWFCNKRAKQNKVNREKYRTSPFNEFLRKPPNRPTGMASLLGHPDGSSQRRRDGRTDGSQGEGIAMNTLRKELSISSSRSSSSGTSSVGGAGVAMHDKGKGKMKDDEVSTLNYSILPNPPSSPPAHFPFHPARLTRTYPHSHPRMFQSAPPEVANFSSPPRSERSESFNPEDLISEQILIIGDPTISASSTPEPSFRSPTASSIFVRPLSSIAPTSDTPTRQSSIASTVYRRGRQRSTRRMTATTMATNGSSTIPDFPSPPPMPPPPPISPFTPPRGYGESPQASREATNETFQDLPWEGEPELYSFPPPALPQQQHSQNHYYSPPSNLSHSRSRSFSSTSEHHTNPIQHPLSRSDSIPYSPPPPPITPRRPPLPTPPSQPPSMRAIDDSHSDLNASFHPVEYHNPLGGNGSTIGLPTYEDAIGRRAQVQAQQVVGVGATGATQRNVLPQYRSPEER